MKTLSLVLLFSFHIYSFSQIYEEREAITQEFKESTPEIILSKLTTDSTTFAKLEIRSAYLESKNMTPEIIGFRISGTDKEAKNLFLSEMIHQNIIPKTAIEKLKTCTTCTHFYLDRITLQWFNGNFTIKTTQSWKINP